jgi:hypothetical protein
MALHALTQRGFFANTQWFAHVQQNCAMIGHNCWIKTEYCICMIGQRCIVHEYFYPGPS